MNRLRHEARILWCDAEANSHRMASRDGVADIVRKAKRARINTIIADVKPLSGEVLYMSDLAPRLQEVGGVPYPQAFDLLQAMVEEGHAAGIPVHANMNIFSEGHRHWNRGPGYSHPEWQVTLYEASRSVRLPGGQTLDIAAVDPLTQTDGVVAYTRKPSPYGSADASCGYLTIRDDTIAYVQSPGSIDEVPEVPANGCVLGIPNTMWPAQMPQPGQPACFHAEPILRLAAESTVPTWGIFVNPIGPAREYELAIMREIVSRYDIDGIVFDRMRYPSLYADFSEKSLTGFQEWVGAAGLDLQKDIFAINDKPWLQPIPGRYYRQWLEWRARQIKSFAVEAAGLVRSIKPSVKVGVYVGSWYESYYDVGVNWGSERFDAGYSWMTPDYHKTGYAELFDYICTGCYYPHATREEARRAGAPEGCSVEAGCDLSNEAIGDASKVYGSLYLLDYRENPDEFGKATEVIRERTQGVMLFDLVYLENYDWWHIPEKLFRDDAVAPHDVQE